MLTETDYLRLKNKIQEQVILNYKGVVKGDEKSKELYKNKAEAFEEMLNILDEERGTKVEKK